jgi:competence protein ComGF
MNQFFRRLPLLAKLLIIAIVPIIFIIFLTAKVYNEKSANVDQIKTYLKSIEQSSTVMEGIKNDLELLIVQKEAKISLHNLPKIKAVPALIYQLFITS